ncbi:MAG: hypothetical protein HY053_09015 [Proteobacteria bacterium]|nr:hypothetical protein [Pseudomonadota bacterium]
MYEPILIESGGENTLEAVHDEISTVQEQFGDCLRDEDMGRDELESVDRLLQARKPSDPKKVARKGAELLEKVETRLKTAAADLQRFDDESQAAARSTGYKVDRLAKALSAIMHVRKKLEEVSE